MKVLVKAIAVKVAVATAAVAAVVARAHTCLHKIPRP